jgi:hypothetical protein
MFHSVLWIRNFLLDQELEVTGIDPELNLKPYQKIPG